MSRVIQDIATVQFQVQNRQANGAMQALQNAAQELSDQMDSVNKKIEALGKDVPKDNPQLLNFQNQLRGIKKDYDDVMRAQRDFLRGAKAADQLWKAAQEGNIESLSFRSIKSGVSGLQKRQSGLSPGDAKDMQDYRIIKQVIDEARRVLSSAETDVQHTIQTIRDGGKVSEQAMRQTISTLRELKESVDETDADFTQWGSDLNFMEAKLHEFTDAQRRARGEIVDAKDARREMNKLTKEGAEAAKRESDAAERKLVTLRDEREELVKQRSEIKKNIETTRQQMDEQQKLIEKKHSELADAQSEATQKQADFNQKQQEGLDAINQVAEGNKALQTTLEGQEQQLKDNSDAVRKNAEETTAAEQEKAQARQLSIKRMEEMLAALQKEYREEELTSEQREKKKAEIKELDEAIRIAKDEWMSYADAEKYAASIGVAGFIGTDQQNKMATEALTRHREELVKTIQQKEADSQATAAERAELEQLDQALTKIKTGFSSADDVLARFAEHMNTGKTASEGMARQSDKLAQAQQRVNDLQDAIRDKEDEVRRLNSEVERAEQEMIDSTQSAVSKPERSSQELKQEADDFLENIKIQERVVENYAKEITEYDKKIGKLQAKIDSINSKQQKRRSLLSSLLTPFTGEGEDSAENAADAERIANSIGESTPWAKRDNEKKAEYQAELDSLKKLADEKRREREDEKAGLKELRGIYEMKRDAYTEALHTEEKLEKAEIARETHRQKMSELNDTLNEKAAMERLRNEEAEKVTLLSEAQQQSAAQTQESKRLTNEQMQQGIKLLEEEYAKTDHTTEEGIKKRQQLREAIDQMNQELKESTGEWMSVADAMKLAGEAEKNTLLGGDGTGFTASAQDIQKATQALERQRDVLLQTIKAKRDSGAATDAEEKELGDLTNKLKALKFEQDNFNMSQAKMQELMRTPTNAVSLDELRNAIKRADGELKRMEGSLGKNNAQYKAFAEQVRNAKNQLKEMEGQAKASATAWEKAWSRLKTYVVMCMGFNAVWQKMMGTADDIMELSDKMGEVRKTTGFTADEVGRLSDNLKRLDVRTPLVQLLEISAKAGQLGLKSEQDVMGFTEAANKLMIALPEMGAEAATEMMKVALATGEVKKIQDQLNKGIVEGSSATEVALSKIGSTIDQLRANSAAAAPQITDFVKRVGAVGAQSGITIDQVAALGATVDAVGLRVEMSATALSRMIPAIRNNAFEVAKAIGMAPNALREMFDEAGGGMEAMLAIFQHIKDSGMDEDSIEKMLGIGNMQDAMKQLNQQGARAGIVFAGLSQNVEELRKNLGTAKEAYEDNIAILQEYNKMNDTAAAKWERFKNQLEEFFAGDFTQRFLGGVIDFLRLGLDLLTGNNGWSAAFRTIGVYILAIKLNIAGIFSGVKNISFSLKGIAMAIGLIDKETKKLAWGNIFTAAAAAILWVVLELKNLKSALDKANESLGKTKEEIGHAKDRFEAYWVKLKDTSAALLQAKASHEKLSAEVDKLRKSTDGSAESTANLKKKEDELTSSEKNVTRASNDHRGAIAQINSIYGKYLGFILTEANYSDLAAAAHDKVTAAIEREMLMKQRQAALGEVDSRYAQDIATGYGDLYERLVQYGKLSRSEAAKAMSDMQRFMRENLSYDAGKNKTVVSQTVVDQLKKQKIDISKADANEIAGLWFDQYLKENYHLSDKVRRGLTGVERRSDVSEGWGTVWTPFASNLRGGYAETYTKRENERGPVALVYDVDADSAKGREGEASTELIKKFEKRANDAKKKILDKSTDDKQRNDAYGELANALEGLDNRINELNPKNDAETINRLNTLATSLKGEGIDIKKLKQAREKIHQTLFERATFNEEDIRNLDTTNPWGGGHDAASTDWKNMTAEQLVARRKQMKEFVNSIQTDSDVKTVLGEDAALKKAIEKGMSSDMRTVIEWYNTERLKIQDELHARHLTNTGDWMDPKKERGAKKQFRDEMDAYLHELDAYYTERKTRIEQARNDEEITEGEAWRRTIQNDNEWQTRRAELQKLYSRKQKEVTQEELDAIYHIIAERTGDSESFVKAQIAKTNQFVNSIEKSGEKGAAIVHRWMSQVELDTERSYLKGQQALTKQIRAIEAIIDKERPFNGITKQLQESLSTMDVLTGEMRKEYNELMKQGKDTADFDARQKQEEMKRTAFLLGEAENAYSTTIDNVMDDMRQKGMTAWADWLSADPKLQDALMAQLRSTYDAIQDAINKEASQLKKQAEIMWNNILMPDGKTTLKQQTDRIVAQLGLDESRVSRANNLIGAGTASQRVADRLAIKQMQLQLNMQMHYYNLMKKQGQAHVDMLEAQAKAARERGDTEEATRKTLDAQHARMSLNLATAKEETELAKQREEIIARTEESQNRLYTSLREWADLLTSSLQGLFEASHAGDAEYYNERAKLELTGKGGPGAGTYIVIDNEGTSDAKAHYEYLDERAALERQHEIQQQNAQAEAWKKVMDDLNAKMNEQITDWMNAALQNESIDANTSALNANTDALNRLSLSMLDEGISKATKEDSGSAITVNPTEQGLSPDQVSEWTEALGDNPMMFWQEQSDITTQNMIDNMEAVKKAQLDTSKAMAQSAQSSFAKMTAAANLYGLAYQTMCNDNLDANQKFWMFALQAAGNAAIGMLTTDLFKAEADNMVQMPGILGKLLGQMPYPAAMATYALVTALMGGLMGMAVSKVAQSKSQIAQATGSSASAGKLTTGMLAYAEGNVNEFTDPASLTVGRQYNVDGADGRTYRARYMGVGAKTHITNGPEFHLVGEKGREAIIDAHTTRNIQLNEPEIWGAIKTLYNGGSLSTRRRTRSRRGVAAFADGNIEDFEGIDNSQLTINNSQGFTPEMLAGFQVSLERNNALLERALADGIKGVFDIYGRDGLVHTYDSAKETLRRHGEKY